MKHGNIASWGFLIAWLMSMVAALLPLLRDRPINVIMLGAGAVFLVLAVVTARKKDAVPRSGD